MNEAQPLSPATSSRPAVILAVTAGVAALLWMLGGVLEVVLLGFAGLLVALFLSGLGAWLAKRLHLSERVGVAAVCLAGVGLTVLVVVLAVPAVAEQVDGLKKELPKAVQRGTELLEGYAWGRPLVERARNLDELAGGETIRQAGGVLSTTFGAVGALLVLTFVGLFVAFEPGLYREGLVRLIPLRRRARAAAVLDELSLTLRRWLAGKVLAMVAVGGLTWLGLVLLDVPLGLTLALVAALLTFIPNFGPILSAVPAVLLALLSSPSKALFVGLLYVGIQALENYLLTPLVQKKTVSLPPAVALLAQVVMGALAGGIGVVVATPLAAAALVVVKRLYVEDVLGDDLDQPSEGHAAAALERRATPTGESAKRHQP
ncbi:MAG: AI-2E family transporter [Myxococcales bacterium]|nr:AI-2E family transporter [Myxococcales bacterium]